MKTRKQIIKLKRNSQTRSFLAIGLMVVVAATVGCHETDRVLTDFFGYHAHFISPIGKTLIKEAVADTTTSSTSAASFVSVTPTPLLVVTPSLTPKDKVLMKTIEVFGSDQLDSMTNLINSESGFNPEAWNKKSGAGGIFQALPFSKTGCTLDDVDCQITWGMGYIKNRYGNPTIAWQFHISNGWY